MEIKGTVGAKRIHTTEILPENAGRSDSTIKQRPAERGSYEMVLLPRQESIVPGVLLRRKLERGRQPKSTQKEMKQSTGKNNDTKGKI